MNNDNSPSRQRSATAKEREGCGSVVDHPFAFVLRSTAASDRFAASCAIPSAAPRIHSGYSARRS